MRAPAARSKQLDFFDALGQLLRELDAPPPARSTRPGRPRKTTAETSPLILHLYRKQIQWLDGYAELLTTYAPGNKKLKRVEIIRGLLLGLAQHIHHHRLTLPEPARIRTERDLQKVIAHALARRR